MMPWWWRLLSPMLMPKMWIFSRIIAHLYCSGSYGYRCVVTNRHDEGLVSSIQELRDIVIADPSLRAGTTQCADIFVGVHQLVQWTGRRQIRLNISNFSWYSRCICQSRSFIRSGREYRQVLPRLGGQTIPRLRRRLCRFARACHFGTRDLCLSSLVYRLWMFLCCAF